MSLLLEGCIEIIEESLRHSFCTSVVYSEGVILKGGGS